MLHGMASNGMSLKELLAALGHSIDSNLLYDLQICHCNFNPSHSFFQMVYFFVAFLVFSTLFLPLRVDPFVWAAGRAKICCISPCSCYLGILPIASVSYHHCSHPYYDCSKWSFFCWFQFCFKDFQCACHNSIWALVDSFWRHCL